MRRLQNYDEKYFLNVVKSIGKPSNGLDVKIIDKAEKVAQELNNRGLSFSARHLKINNY
jgi:hypothetical protein